MTPYKRLQVAAFLFLLLVVLFLVFKTIQPFLNMLVLAVVLSILFQPLHKKIRAHIHSPTSAALLTTGIILLIILIPMSKMSIKDYVVQIGLRYLMIPAISIGMGCVMRNSKMQK